jgi:hypothetical protein
MILESDLSQEKFTGSGIEPARFRKSSIDGVQLDVLLASTTDETRNLP